jgi:hypothetical protein
MIPFSNRQQNNRSTMKKLVYSFLIGSLFAGAVGRASAQGFNSGSTGAYGAMNITGNTGLDLPPDGVFHCTTINVAPGVTLWFNRNELNTPVYLLATGDVTISGTINLFGGNGTATLAGVAGVGGFDGGGAGVGGLPAGAGQGPGAGGAGTGTAQPSERAGGGAYGGTSSSLQTPNNGTPYGSPLLVPLVGGSGGGGSPTAGGGGGGGAILIASSGKITVGSSGVINARGGLAPGAWGGGSGGAIRLVAHEVAGTGRLDVGSDYAGAGRVRIAAIVRKSANYNIVGPWTFGGFMAAFPNPEPRLDITSAAGTAISEGTSSGITLNLPFGTSPNQNITVQARNFAAAVPIRLVLTPESGQPVSYDATIDNNAANPASVTIPVTVPLSTVVSVHAWTR